MEDELRSPYITPPASISAWPRDHAYDDIIMLPHHTSATHSRMSMLQRAAQFSPFAALTGYEDAVLETARITDGYMELDADRIAEIDEVLQEIQSQLEQGSHPFVSITYFVPDDKKDGGAYIEKRGQVLKISNFEKKVVFADKSSVNIPLIYDISVVRQNR